MKTRKKPVTTYLNAFLAVTVTVGVIVAWFMAPKSTMRTYLFLLLGGVIFWLFYAIVSLREDKPQDSTGPSEEHKRSVQQYEERLASSKPIFTYGILTCIVSIFLFQMLSGQKLGVDSAGLVKPATRSGEWWRLLSSTYLHGGGAHIFWNAGALRFFGRDFEACSTPAHLPLVYLLSALGGSLASLLLIDQTSVGASGAILGLGGYMLVAARRGTSGVPSWLGSVILFTFGINAYIGFFAYSFIDNAAHAGGAATGALVGMAVIPRPGKPLMPALDRAIKILGWAAALTLLAGAIMTGLILMR